VRWVLERERKRTSTILSLPPSRAKKGRGPQRLFFMHRVALYFALCAGERTRRRLLANPRACCHVLRQNQLGSSSGSGVAVAAR